MATPGIAANAYAQIARIANPAGGGVAGIAGDATGAAGGNFGSMLKEAIGSVAELGRKSDAQTQSVAAGKANIVDVVTAVSETEVAIDAVVAVRDKVIAAYEEIMRMPI
jgi:flagellar hook-basal body complex protein FliE